MLCSPLGGHPGGGAGAALWAQGGGATVSCPDRRRPCAQSRVPTRGQALFLALGIL